MPATSKYFVTSSVGGKNWIDFDLDLDFLRLVGQEIVFTGSTDADWVRVKPGIVFDF